MQHHIVTGTFPYALPLDVATMPQFLAAAGYTTAMLGKWHLGHFKTAHLPTSRGFDSFVGFYSGFQDYFSHVSESTICGSECLVDLRYGSKAVLTTDDEDVAFGSGLWRTAFADLVANHDSTVPLFVYYAESLIHEPIEAPASIFEADASLLDSIPDEGRRGIGAMTMYLDANIKVSGLFSLAERLNKPCY